MGRKAIFRIIMAVFLIGIGWGAKTQTRVPDFELIVNAPGGETTIECVRGCTLKWVERGIIGEVPPQETSFYFSCGGQRCSSAKVGGWLSR
jgi:hypothetical protein